MVESEGIPFREQDVRCDVTVAEVRAASIAQRGRLLNTLLALPAGDWSQPTRCPAWTVRDVVVHLAQMNGLILDAVTAARAGERFTGFAGFDPKTTPPRWVQDAVLLPAEEALEEFERSTYAVLSATAELDDDGALLVATPAGRQPWPRAMLHALFDSAVHERDILAAFGGATGAAADEMGPISSYQLLLAARVACLAGLPLLLTVCLDEAPPLSVTVAGARVEVRRGVLDGAPVATGPAAVVLDALTGRGDLSTVLTGAPDAVPALAMFAALV